MIRAIIVLWAQRILHSDRAQQGDLSVFQEARTHQIVQFAGSHFSAKKAPSLKVPALQGHKATRQDFNPSNALETALQAPFVRRRQFDPSIVHGEHTVCWATLHAVIVLLVMLQDP